jgi:hypothetical protein
MGWVKDILPATAEFQVQSSLHPYTAGIVSDVRFQVCAAVCWTAFLTPSRLTLLDHPHGRVLSAGCVVGDAASVDPDTRSIAYSYCWTANPAAATECLQSWANVTYDPRTAANAYNVTATGLSLMLSATYYCVVRACNDAGLCNSTTSDGVTIGALRSINLVAMRCLCLSCPLTALTLYCCFCFVPLSALGRCTCRRYGSQRG